jgi:hypothetical protein
MNDLIRTRTQCFQDAENPYCHLLCDDTGFLVRGAPAFRMNALHRSFCYVPNLRDFYPDCGGRRFLTHSGIHLRVFKTSSTKHSNQQCFQFIIGHLCQSFLSPKRREGQRESSASALRLRDWAQREWLPLGIYHPEDLNYDHLFLSSLFLGACTLTVNYIYLVNMHLRYRAQPVAAVWGNSRCLL